jgi:hypothetical protein
VVGCIGGGEQDNVEERVYIPRPVLRSERSPLGVNVNLPATFLAGITFRRLRMGDNPQGLLRI